MREIIFRGKNPVGKWETGLLHMSGEKTFIVGDQFCAEVDPDTVGEYTGVEDACERCIFEGDIVRAVLPGTNTYREYVWPLQVVRFVNGAFGLEHGRNFTPLQSYSPAVEFTIMGNAHDDPGLMEVRDV